MLARAACPHDRPDTCAMHVTVEEGRATHVTGDPDHPITAGFLCGKVSNYLDRVYAEDRLLHPQIRVGPKGRRVPSGDVGRGARCDRRRAAARAGRARRRVDPPLQLHGHDGVRPVQRDERPVHERAGSQRAGADHLRHRRDRRSGLGAGVSPEVDPEEWPHARYLLLWGWNPMSTAPHLWRKLLDARENGARLVVVDPFRSRTARVADEHLRRLPGTDAALALGMMRAIVDAGLQDEEWCRAHTRGYDELTRQLDDHPVERCAAACGVDAAVIARVGREFAQTQPALLRLGVGAQRHMGAPTAYSTIACLPALVVAWRHRGGGCSYIPTATAGAVSSAPLEREDLRPGPVRKINMSQLGRALTDADLEPPVTALVVWNSNPATIAPDQERVLAGLRREDLFTVVLEQFMTDTAAHADVVLPATTQPEHLDTVFSWGHHYMTWNEPAIEPRGEAKPNSEVFRLLAERMGLDDPCYRETDEQMLTSVFECEPGGISLPELRERGWQKIDLGQGPTPHADGNFVTESGKLELRADYVPPAEVADEALAERFPLSMVTPKTHLYLNSTFANQRRQHRAQPRPYVVLNPGDAAPIEDGSLVRVFNDRGDFVCEAHVSDDARPEVVVAPMGWWSSDYRGGKSAQATTSQELTELGAAPIFNDNRVEVESA